MEKRTVVKRGLLGFMAGVFVSHTMAIILSLIVGNGTFYPVDVTLLEGTTASINAVLIQYIGTGLIGMLMGVNFWIFEKEDWNIATQTVVHFLVTAGSLILYLICTNAGRVGISRSVFYVLVLAVIYFVLWMVRMRSWYVQVKKLRQKMQELSEEEFTAVDKRIQRNNRMIRGFLIGLLIIVLLVGFVIGKHTVWREWKIASLTSTDLSNVTIDGACVHDSIEKLELSKYTESDRYSGAYRYLFDELCVDTDETNRITSLFTRVDEAKTEISVNGIIGLTTIDQVEAVLGKDYYEYRYDQEQLLNALVYQDKEHGMIATFVFFAFDGKSENDRMLTWIELETN